MLEYPLSPDRLSTTVTAITRACSAYDVSREEISRVAHAVLETPGLCIDDAQFPVKVYSSPGKSVRVVLEKFEGTFKVVESTLVVDGQTKQIKHRATKRCKLRLPFTEMRTESEILELIKTRLGPSILPMALATLDLHERSWNDNQGLTIESNYRGKDLFSMTLPQENPVQFVLGFFAKQSFGLWMLHALDILHGDIKPQNLLSGGAITDFGTAELEIAEPTRIRGTRNYTAPEMYATVEEQMQCMAVKTKACDVYAFSKSIFDVLIYILIPNLVQNSIPETQLQAAVLSQLEPFYEQMISVQEDQIPKLVDQYEINQLRWMEKRNEKHIFRLQPNFDEALDRISEIVTHSNEPGLEPLIDLCRRGLSMDPGNRPCAEEFATALSSQTGS